MQAEQLPQEPHELIDDSTILSVTNAPVKHRDDDCDCAEED